MSGESDVLKMLGVEVLGSSEDIVPGWGIRTTVCPVCEKDAFVFTIDTWNELKEIDDWLIGWFCCLNCDEKRPWIGACYTYVKDPL